MPRDVKSWTPLPFEQFVPDLHTISAGFGEPPSGLAQRQTHQRHLDVLGKGVSASVNALVRG